jgi:hypothetical protein
MEKRNTVQFRIKKCIYDAPERLHSGEDDIAQRSQNKNRVRGSEGEISSEIKVVSKK